MNIAFATYAHRYKKLKELILYALKSASSMDVEMILGIISAADFKAYGVAGKSITGLKYIKRPEGMVPEGFYECVNDLVREKLVQITLVDA